jgi:hypothetical protein
VAALSFFFFCFSLVVSFGLLLLLGFSCPLGMTVSSQQTGQGPQYTRSPEESEIMDPCLQAGFGTILSGPCKGVMLGG